MNQIYIIEDNIVNMNTDAIVNATNNSLLGGGGVDGAIHRAAGKQLLKECRNLKGCLTGEAKMTKGYDLKAKWIIHTVGPIWKDGTNSEDLLLRNCYKNSLILAEKHKLNSIAFPSISTGTYHFPIKRAARIAINEITGTIRSFKHLKEIFMVLFDKNTFNIYKEEYENMTRERNSYE